MRGRGLRLKRRLSGKNIIGGGGDRGCAPAPTISDKRKSIVPRRPAVHGGAAVVKWGKIIFNVIVKIMLLKYIRKNILLNMLLK
jgi:hypothetical protein